MNALLKIVSALLPSAIVLILTAWLITVLEHLTPAQVTVVKWLPPALFLGAMIQALHFNRTRIFFAVLNLAVAYAALGVYAPSSSEFARTLIFAATAVFLPVNLLATAYLKDQGPRPSWRHARFWLLLAEIIVVVVIAEYPLPGLAGLFTLPLLDPSTFYWTSVPQPGLAALTVALFTLYGRMHSQPTVQRAAFFGVLVALTLMLARGAPAAHVIGWLSAAAILFILAVARESWNLAYLDALTELPGRRALEEALDRLNGQFAVAMLDVDHFKKFNDTYGHHVGDEVLRMVAFQIREVGGGGKAFRYGGEEFCILFPGRKAAESAPHLEHVREQIADAQFEMRSNGRRRGEDGKARTRKRNRSKTISVTISIGLAEVNARQSKPAAVVTAADRALYRAKKKGRNQLSR